MQGPTEDGEPGALSGTTLTSILLTLQLYNTSNYNYIKFSNLIGYQQL